MIKALEQKLHHHSIKPTAVRLLVLEYLLNSTTAVSLTDIYEAFEKSDRITLYRTLKVFEDQGLVHSIEDGTGAPKYALCRDGCDIEHHEDTHIHFHCDKCGQTFCLPKYRIPAFELPENFSGREVNLVVKGICNICKE